MSKLTKLFNHPVLFFKDSKTKQHDKAVLAPVTATNTKVKQTAKAVNDKTMKTDIEYSQELLSFKNSYPVNNIKVKGIHYWPVIRHFLWIRLQHAYKQSNNIQNINPAKYFINRNWHTMYKNDYNFKEIDDIGGDINLDFLFFTNLRGTEQTTIDGKIYNRITDPVFEVAKTIGKAEKIEIIKSTGYVNLDRHHEPTYVLPPLERTIGRFNFSDISDDFYKEVLQKVPSAMFDQKSTLESIEWFFHAKDIFKKILEKKRPKAVFYIGFDYYFPLALAAHELGIKTVDLQHGVQGGWSPLYNFWDEVPPCGYEVLPDYFWVWGEHDKNGINNEFKSTGPKPIIGGYPWMDMQIQFTEKLSKKITGRLDTKKLVGIITLQDQTIFPKLFSDIISSTADSVTWIIKRHPKYKNINLREQKNTIYGVEVDGLPFVNFLDTVDIHLTECSTAIIEADYFGVKNFVSGKQGLANYGDYIDKGTVHYISNVTDFKNKVKGIDFSIKKPIMKTIDNNVKIKNILNEIIS